MTNDPTLALLNRLVGNWTAEATHPDLPGEALRGTASMEWLQGERFLIYRTHMEHPEIPDSMSVIGRMDQDRAQEGKGSNAAVGAPPDLRMHYYDTRGVFRAFDVSIDQTSWKMVREAPGFSQRFTATFADGGKTIVMVTQLRRDDVHWVDDLKVTYRAKTS